MSNLKEYIKQVDSLLMKKQPKTMDELIYLTHTVEGSGNYGTSFKIVKYKGYLQGIRIFVTAKKNTYQLPAKNKVYATMQGTEKYEKAGYPVIWDNN